MSNGTILIYLGIFVALFVIVFIIMLVGFSRAGKRRQSMSGGDPIGQPARENRPATRPTNVDPRGEDIGGNFTPTSSGEANRNSNRENPRR